MVFDKSDPRAALASVAGAKPQTGLIAEPQLEKFYDAPPSLKDTNGSSWLLRGNNFILAETVAEPGGVFHRNDQADEYALLLPESRAVISAGGADYEVPENSIAFIPPGTSAVRLPDGGRFTRFFTSKSEDLLKLCSNTHAYDEKRGHIPDFAPWPAPAGGPKVRHYTLDVPKEDGRFGRIFRCTTFMINVLDPYDGPRDTTKMSPHHHDDFEQCSLVLQGAYSHHLRWPWTTDFSDWRDDEEIKVSGPSALVIPPPVIHTSRATGQGLNKMVDVFCPPRMDFSKKPGWVLNSADYPMPE